MQVLGNTKKSEVLFKVGLSCSKINFCANYTQQKRRPINTGVHLVELAKGLIVWYLSE